MTADGRGIYHRVMDILLGYAAGVLTLINPCVLPVIPIVLASALQASRSGPILLVAGMSLSFVILGMLVSTVGYAIGLTPETVSKSGAVLMVGFGVVLLVPRASRRFAAATAGFSARADLGMESLDQNTNRGQFLGGMLLGAVWSPCIGPTIGGAIALASQGESLFWAGSIMTAFALGVSTAMLALAYGTRSALQRRQAALRAATVWARPLLGAVFILVGLGVLSGLQYGAEGWLLDALPAWLVDFSVSL